MKQRYFFAVIALVAVAAVVSANHSWGNYHWARTANPFTLKLGDNVTSVWDSYLGIASSDWSASSVLDTTIVSGGTDGRKCRATTGRVEVCNAKYGANGWLGLASIWASGDHITKGTAKMNDTYFNTTKYNTPSWKQFVVCQEIAHTFGLDHQDEKFDNPNLGSCMDYTNDPGRNDGAGDNLHPNSHDFEQLKTIYAHTDNTTTLSDTINDGKGKPAEVGQDISGDDPSAWGKAMRQDARGRDSLYVRDLGKGEKVFTFVIWAD